MDPPMEDKCPAILSFLLPIYEKHDPSRRPLVVGISGGQGSGKTTLTNQLANVLRNEPYSLNVVVFSIDDIYLTRRDQVALAQAHPENPLVQVRGEPGTHDIELGRTVLEALKAQKPTHIPAYDKSRFGGAGDRTDPTTWRTAEPPFDIVIFEGWCVGFRALQDEELEKKWRESKETNSGVIGTHRLENLLFINSKLRNYDVLTDKFDVLIHIDAKELSYIYDWRIQQEHDLIAVKGSGMSDEEVIKFVNCYMPAYELYVDRLRKGVLDTGRQLRFVIGKDWNAVTVEVL